jgi:hypothetical protein
MQEGCVITAEKNGIMNTSVRLIGLCVLDELYALFSTDDIVDCSTTACEDEQEIEETCCCLSSDTSVISGVKTLQFQGQFQHRSVLILVDSGSSTFFISQ